MTYSLDRIQSKPLNEQRIYPETSTSIPPLQFTIPPALDNAWTKCQDIYDIYYVRSCCLSASSKGAASEGVCLKLKVHTWPDFHVDFASWSNRGLDGRGRWRRRVWRLLRDERWERIIFIKWNSTRNISITDHLMFLDSFVEIEKNLYECEKIPTRSRATL